MKQDAFQQLQQNIENAKLRTAARRQAIGAPDQTPADRTSDPAGDKRPQLQEFKGHSEPSEKGFKKVPGMRTRSPRPSDPDNQNGIQGLDGIVQGKFRLSIVVHVSDRRPRDINGAASTLLDVIRDAARSFLIAAGPKARGWVAANLPLDDSRLLIPGLKVYAVDCPKGQERAEILIEPISDADLEAELSETQRRLNLWRHLPPGAPDTLPAKTSGDTLNGSTAGNAGGKTP